MKTLKEYANAKKGGSNVILARRVQSKYTKGKYYNVELHSNGYLDCSCIAGTMKNICSHQECFIKWIIENGKKNKYKND